MDRTVTAIYENGVLRPLDPLSIQERDELARHIPAGRPLSEIIIKEREGR